MEATLKKSKTKKHMRENITGYLFIAPNLIGFVVFVFIPVVFSLVISFTDWNIFKGLKGMHFVGLNNYKDLFTDVWFVSSIRNNLLYTLVTIPVIIVISIITAVILNNKVYCRNTIRALFFLPYIANVVAISTVWMMLYNPANGLINQFLRSIGISNPPQWLASTRWALPAIMIIGIWAGIGYNTVVYMAGLQGISPSLYESASIDGANIFQKFFKITVPMLSPTTFFLLITDIIGSFQVFGQINIMTGGGPGTSTTVIAYYIYQSGFKYYKMGYAASIAWFLLLGVFVVTLIQWQGQKKWVNY